MNTIALIALAAASILPALSQAQISMEEADMIALTYRQNEIKGSYAFYACQDKPAFDIYERIAPGTPSSEPVIHVENEYAYFIDEQPYPSRTSQHPGRYLLISKEDGSCRVVRRPLPPFGLLPVDFVPESYCLWFLWQYCYSAGLDSLPLSFTDSIALSFREKHIPLPFCLWKCADTASAIILPNLSGDTVIHVENASVYFCDLYNEQSPRKHQPGASSLFLLVDRTDGSCDTLGANSSMIPASLANLDTTWVVLEQRFETYDFPFPGLRNESVSSAPLALLWQNVPNPATGETRIRYEIADGTANARIGIYELNGQEVAMHSLPETQGELVLKAGEFTPGMYLYSLIVNGQVQDTKRMVVTR